MVFKADSLAVPEYQRYQPNSSSALAVLQELVGGDLAVIKHKDGPAARFTAYRNAAGKGPAHLAANPLAWGVLYRLNFSVPQDDMFFYGTVVVVGRDEGALTDADVVVVRVAAQSHVRVLSGASMKALAVSADEDDIHSDPEDDFVAPRRPLPGQ